MIKEIAALPQFKPRLRGYFHQAAFFLSLIAGLVLISQSRDTKSFVSALIYSLSLSGLLGVSALYHRVQWSANRRMWMKRLDHSFIFILIWGTATPVSLLAMSDTTGIQFFMLVSIAAGMGVMQSLFWVKAPKTVAVLLYLAVGWLVVPYISELNEALGSEKIFLLLLGGLFYSVGAVIYAVKQPNPWPHTFGYHEIFHIMVVIAAALHWLVIIGLV